MQIKLDELDNGYVGKFTNVSTQEQLNRIYPLRLTPSFAPSLHDIRARAPLQWPRHEKKVVEIPSPKTNTASSVSLRINSSICTLPLFRNEAFLKQKYHGEKMSARRIAVLIGCSHSTINDALDKFGLAKQLRLGGWVPYGTKLTKSGRIEHVRQQKIINGMRKRKRDGWSNAKIAADLNSRGIASPAGKGTWYAATVGKILRPK